MAEKPSWIRKLMDGIIYYRLLIVFLIVVMIILFGLYLNCSLEWELKDVIQICTGFLVVLSLFYNAMSYEFTAKKTELEIKSARDHMNYAAAMEWHKSPVKDYQKTVIAFEKKFYQECPDRTLREFRSFFEKDENLEYKEALKGILNFFETLCIGVHDGLLDIKQFYDSIFITYYVDYYPYIQQRQHENKDIWDMFTSVTEKWDSSLKEKVENGILSSTVIQGPHINFP